MCFNRISASVKRGYERWPTLANLSYVMATS